MDLLLRLYSQLRGRFQSARKLRFPRNVAVFFQVLPKGVEEDILTRLTAARKDDNMLGVCQRHCALFVVLPGPGKSHLISLAISPRPRALSAAWPSSVTLYLAVYMERLGTFSRLHSHHEILGTTDLRKSSSLSGPSFRRRMERTYWIRTRRVLKADVWQQ